jgi:hypothetical protein
LACKNMLIDYNAAQKFPAKSKNCGIHFLRVYVAGKSGPGRLKPTGSWRRADRKPFVRRATEADVHLLESAR